MPQQPPNSLERLPFFTQPEAAQDSRPGDPVKPQKNSRGRLFFIFSGSQAPAWEPILMQSSCFAQKPQSLGQTGSRPAELGTRGAFPSWSLGTREKWKTGVDHQPRPHLIKTGKQRTQNSKLETGRPNHRLEACATVAPTTTLPPSSDYRRDYPA